jgi:hypothetical protein
MTASRAATIDRLGVVFAVLLVVAFLLVLASAGELLVRFAHVSIDPARLSAVRLGVAGSGLAAAIGTALAWWL